jgi:hypothetical protein
MASHHQLVKKTNEIRSDWRRAAAVVAAGLLAAAALTIPASAQYRQENAGRALDANSRVGGTGTNDAGPQDSRIGRGPMVTGNQIVTGNVTAGRRFRGPVGYTDPGSFRDITGGSLATDRFVSDSAGVPRRGGPEVNLSQPTAFYGSNRAAPPPVGYVPTVGATGGFIPSSDSAVTPDYRNRPMNYGLDPTLRTGELMLPALDQGNQQSVLTASPLYGIRVWPAGTGPNDFLAPGVRPEERADRFRVDQNTIDRMREEVNRAALGGGDPTRQGAGGTDGQDVAEEGTATTPSLIKPLDTSIGGNPAPGAGAGPAGNTGAQQGGVGGAGASDRATPGAGGLAARPITAPLPSGAINSGTVTNQSIRRQLNVAADKQTPQLAQLRKHFERRGGAQGDVDANRQFNLEMRAQGQGAAGQRGGQQPGQAQPGQLGQAQPGQAQPGGVGAGVGVGIGGARNTNVPPAGDKPVDRTPQPIKTLAKDVPAEGLRQLLQSAEDLMRQQKFSQALEKYNVAQEVAPNNPLIILGRANAQLAASYYRRAESDLREAVSRAPEVVVAQFDLRSLIGEERLQTLVKDLKDIAANDPQEARPLLLLAYIAYNTGNEEQAAHYLAQAEQRVKGEDKLLKAWRQQWNLPKTDGAEGNAEPAPAPAADDNK